jgi:2-polyprenyl-6-methoxyphenol hydroxylase-like FAD-dependent oxidoreductase
MSDHQVVVVGAGPAGMMLAAELTLADVDVVVIERRPTIELESPRSRGLHARTLEVLDQRGIAGRFVAAGTPAQVQAFAGVPLDIGDFPTRHPHGLALLQSDFERILAGWIDELGVRVLRNRTVTGYVHHDDHVRVTCADGTEMRADYLVGCDGGRSIIRKTAGIEFAGWDPTVCWIHTEVEVDELPAFGLRGGGGIGPAGGGRVGITLAETDVDNRFSEPSLDDVRAALVRIDGTHYGARSPRFISRFTDATRQAVTYRAGRVLLAGDAAHVHAPFGGQGLNLGVQDAVNLGWKLAQVLHGTSPDALLDTYHAERHPIAARVLRSTMAQRALQDDDERTAALRDVVADLLALDEPRRTVAAAIAGLDIQYGPGDHPMIGRRMPDLELATATGPTRVYEQLHRADWLLITLDRSSEPGPTPWDDHLRRLAAATSDTWELPVLGPVDPPTAVLVRPDGYVAWVGTDAHDAGDGLDAALAAWFGTPSTITMRPT